MRKRLEQLQAQHPTVRTRVAVLFASAITALVALIWITTLPTRFSSSAVSSDTSESSLSSAISGLSDAIAPQVGDIQSSFEAIGGLQVVPNPETGTTQNTPAASTEIPTGGY